LLGLLGLAFCFASTGPTSAQTFTTLDPPLAVDGSFANGIDGDKIVGRYRDSSARWHGFLLDGSSNYTTLDYPSGTTYTEFSGISGNNIVGSYWDLSNHSQSFVFDGSTYQALTPPGATSTKAYGISGENVVGTFATSSEVHAFFYDGLTYTALDYPSARYGTTVARGISANKIVGSYMSPITSEFHGFLYDILSLTYSTLDHPLAAAQGTIAVGISGDDIVGFYFDADHKRHGFLYDGSIYTTFDIPGVAGTGITGISGENIVGYYYDSSGIISHGYVASIPEPSTLAMLFIGGINLLGYGVWRLRHGRLTAP
jgi:hypothetical protein